MSTRTRLYLLVLFAWGLIGWGLAASHALPPPEAARAAAPTPTADERWLVSYAAPGGGLIQTDHRLIPALDLLATLDAGRELLDDLADGSILVVLGSRAFDELRGFYDADTGAIVIDPALLVADPRALAAMVAHEATHAHDDICGHQDDADPRLGPVRGCVLGELRARLAELDVWQQFYGPDGKPQPAHEYEADLNDELARYVAAPRQY